MFDEKLRIPKSIRFLCALLLGLGAGGCFTSAPTPSVPAFLIVVNRSGTTGLIEYSLPLATGEQPLYSLPPAGTYEGGVPVQNDLFVFGTDANSTWTLWRYTLPLSKSPSPSSFTGFAGTPVAALSLANGQYVLFLEKTGSQACLEGFAAGSLISATSSSLPSPTLTCNSSNFSSISGTFQGGTMQLSADGSSLFVETTYLSGTSSQTTEQTFSAASIVNGVLPKANATYTLSATLATFPVEGAVESDNVLLLLPDPSVPGIDFYTVTSVLSGSGKLAPLAQNTAQITPLPSLLTLDPFGSFVYMATATPGGSPSTIWSFSLNEIQNGSNVAPFAQIGAGLTPVSLLTVVGTQG